MRAGSVVRLFVDSGIAPQRLVAIGHGDTRPIATNDTPEGRMRNRRVQLMVMSNLPEDGKAGRQDAQSARAADGDVESAGGWEGGRAALS